MRKKLLKVFNPAKKTKITTKLSNALHDCFSNYKQTIRPSLKYLICSHADCRAKGNRL